MCGVNSRRRYFLYYFHSEEESELPLVELPLVEFPLCLMIFRRLLLASIKDRFFSDVSNFTLKLGVSIASVHDFHDLRAKLRGLQQVLHIFLNSGVLQHHQGPFGIQGPSLVAC